MKKMAYLGPPGTFSNMALDVYLKRHNMLADPMPASSIFDLFTWLSEKKCDEIIVPVENSVEGSVTTTLDLMIQSENVVVNAELSIEVVHCLMSLPGCRIESITDIMSHPQVLAQCSHYIHQKFPKVRTHQTSSTAVAVEQMVKGAISPDLENPIVAVIGNRELATLYGLDILDSSVNDYPNNRTRFAVIGYEQTHSTGQDKTSVILSTTKDKSGGLYEVLGEFADRDINLTKISSRPTKEVLGEYLFFIDFEGHNEDKKVKDTLDAIKLKTSYFKNLGSYRRDTII